MTGQDWGRRTSHAMVGLPVAIIGLAAGIAVGLVLTASTPFLHRQLRNLEGPGTMGISISDTGFTPGTLTLSGGVSYTFLLSVTGGPDHDIASDFPVQEVSVLHEGEPDAAQSSDGTPGLLRLTAVTGHSAIIIAKPATTGAFRLFCVGARSGDGMNLPVTVS